MEGSKYLEGAPLGWDYFNVIKLFAFLNGVA